MAIGRQRLIAAVLWAAVVAVGWFAYSPALGGTFLLDDIPNLSGLRFVEDGKSAIIFMLSGTAGPTGRPLALATFLPQAAEWGGSAEPFLRVNILIHLLNACVLAWVLFRLSILCVVRESRAIFVAVAAAGVWLFLPLLASSTLMVIQRMTTLSAFFVLIGLAGYLRARQSIERRPAGALTGMSIALTTCTTLAILAKENGALLPTFVLVMEATVLNRPANVKSSHWQTWKSVFLVVPTVIILAYLLCQIPYNQELALRRGFTAWERLLTESRILWEYLFNAFIPQLGRFGPFHDSYPVARTIMDPVTFLAFSGCLVLLILGIIWRRRFPFFSFAILWYLGGHLLESTTIPLMPYFEHRNYLPIVGPLLALFTFAAQIPSHRIKLVYLGTSIYILVNASVLFSLASLWGNPPMAFRYWQEQFPTSLHATTAAIGYQLTAEGPKRTVQTLNKLVASQPELGYLKIKELQLSCTINSQKNHQGTVVELNRLLKHVDFSYTALTMLSQLAERTNRTACNGVDGDTIRKFARILLDNPSYGNDVLYKQLHHELMALMAQYQGRGDEAMQHLQKANAYLPSTGLNEMIVITYAAASDFDSARAFIEEARLNAPHHPIRRYMWLTKLERLSQYVDGLEEHST